RRERGRSPNRQVYERRGDRCPAPAQLDSAEGGRQNDTAPGQTLLQLLASPGDAPGNRPLLPTQFLGRFGMALSLETTQHERCPVLLWQAVNLIVQDRLDFSQCCFAYDLLFAMPLKLGLFFTTAHSVSLDIHGSPIGDPVQPTGHRVGFSDRRGFGGEDQECDLKSVV